MFPSHSNFKRPGGDDPGKMGGISPVNISYLHIHMDQLMFHQYLYGYFMVALEIHQNGSNMFKPLTKHHEGLWRGCGKQTTTKNGFPHLYKSQRPKCQPFPNPKISLIAGSWLAQIDARPLTKNPEISRNFRRFKSLF